jgi:hypothetical protein
LPIWKEISIAFLIALILNSIATLKIITFPNPTKIIKVSNLIKMEMIFMLNIKVMAVNIFKARNK